MAGKIWGAILLLCLLSACAITRDENDLDAIITPASFSDMKGWQQDSHAKAFSVFVKSCEANARRAQYFTTKTGNALMPDWLWRRTCEAARSIESPQDEEARRFFEQYFLPYRITTQAHSKGRTTGYYEPLLYGSYKKTPRFSVPVYGVPYRFSKPSASRAQIEAGALVGKAPVLLYVDDPVMLFFLHIQGSGKVRMHDGTLVSLQYAQQNGHEYVPIGRVMKEQGLLDTVSMQSIRDWLRAHPQEAASIMNTNPSYIFFTLRQGGAPAKGAQGIPLTAIRSLAVDDERVPYGLPIYLDTHILTMHTNRQKPFTRLMIAQDTGGAIIGATRYDIFFGRGVQAEWHAGHQNERAKIFWLLPREQ